jgi:hypothetical protein
MPTEEMFPIPEIPKGYLAGAVICKKEKIKFNVGRKRWAVEVKNAGDRPIQVSRLDLDTVLQLTSRSDHITHSLRRTLL